LRDFQIILEQAAFAGKEVLIRTKDRGIIAGVFTGVDEFEADSEKLGFCIDISDDEYDVVFPDEIIEITTRNVAPHAVERGLKSQSDYKYPSGK